ncbi:MAG: EcsC family protein [Isosphaerales bacterium]
MSTQSKAARAKLTPYESEQVERIAAWKSMPPHPFSELFKRIALPVAKAVERVLPDRVVRMAIEKAYDASEMLAGQADIKLQAGVRDLRDMLHKPLEECDGLADQVSAGSQAWATVQGAATGAGGVLTTLIDIPLLFVLSLRTIVKIGHCYGYPLEGTLERRLVLGLLITATAGTLETKHKRLEQLKELEDLVIEETQEEILSEEALSVLFQLEIFDGVPGVGVISGALLNLAFLRRVDRTAMRVFQERWLRDNGKIRTIAPAATHARDLAPGWSGAFGRAAHAGVYTLGFGAALPVCFVASLFKPMDNGKIAPRPISRG